MKLKVLWIYAKEMNIYGDYGNILALKKQAELRGIHLKIVKYSVGDEFPEDCDIIIGGGGQDSGQGKIQDDLLKNGEKLKQMAKHGIPMLMICGLYQLFGDFFETISGEKIQGIGIFSGVKTIAGRDRMIGNIREKSEKFGEIVGYENHSGQTYLSIKNQPLAKVISGAGNNIVGDHEGAIYKNVIGTYLHGSILPKNPAISIFLLEKACENRGWKLPEVCENHAKEAEILAEITHLARKFAKKRPR